MRRWGILLGIVVLVLVAALVVAALNLNRFLNQNRDLIAKQAQRAIGREVRFGEVGVSFAGGLGVRVEDLHVGDDPAFSKEDFVTAEAVDVGVKILPALFGRIELGRVVLRSPSISVIQTSQGLSIDSLGGAKQEPAQEKGPPPALLVSLVDIRDGTLRFVDQTAKPPAELRVAQLDFSASDVSLTDPVRFELSAALLGAEKPNLSASGTLGPLQSDSPRADLELRIDPLVVDEVLRLRQVAKALPPELSASGPVRLEVEAEGTLAKLRFEATLDARGAAVKYGESFDKARGVPLDLLLRGEKTGNDLVLETLEARIDETQLRGRATREEPRRSRRRLRAQLAGRPPGLLRRGRSEGVAPRRGARRRTRGEPLAPARGAEGEGDPALRERHRERRGVPEPRPRSAAGEPARRHREALARRLRGRALGERLLRHEERPAAELRPSHPARGHARREDRGEPGPRRGPLDHRQARCEARLCAAPARPGSRSSAASRATATCASPRA